MWINLWSTYRKSNVAQEKEMILFALGCINDEEILTRQFLSSLFFFFPQYFQIHRCSKFYNVDRTVFSRYLYKLVNEYDQDISKQDRIQVFTAVFNRAKGINAGLQLIRRLLPAMM